MLNKIGIKEIVKNSERLQRVIDSIFEDIKKLQNNWNNNFKWLSERLDEIESKIDKLEQVKEIDDSFNNNFMWLSEKIEGIENRLDKLKKL